MSELSESSESSEDIEVIHLTGKAVKAYKHELTQTARPTQLAYIMYSSGSTGRPRGVMVIHRNVVRLVKNAEFVPLSDDTRILQTGAPVFDAVTFEIWGGLLNGGGLVPVGVSGELYVGGDGVARGTGDPGFREFLSHTFKTDETGQ